MACTWISKKRTFHQEVPKDTSRRKPTTENINANTRNNETEQKQQNNITDANHLTEQITSEQKQQNNITHTTSFIINNSFHDWKVGSINIRSGKEKSQGAKMYAIASETD